MAASPLADVNPRDLAQLAASIPIPSDLPFSARARAFIDVAAIGPEHRPPDPCTHTTVYQVVFGLDGGRRDVPVGPLFADHAAASALVRLLNRAWDGDATSAPEPIAPRTCSVCGTALPAGSRPHRMTCGETCRQRLARERRQAAQDRGRPLAATALRVAVGRVGAAQRPLAVSLGAPAESVTARAEPSPLVQLELGLPEMLAEVAS